MGCVSDAVLFGSLRRLRVWALAIAVALLGSQALDWAGLVDLGAQPLPAAGPVLARRRAWAALLFGFGMVLAGGCVSRNLVRLGGGSLKALVTLLVMGVAAFATTLGVLTPLHRGLRAVGIAMPARSGRSIRLPAVLAALTGRAPASGRRSRRWASPRRCCVLPARTRLSPLARAISRPGWCWARSCRLGWLVTAGCSRSVRADTRRIPDLRRARRPACTT